eukprot:3086260-Amphidinium_carterae.1
MGSLASLLRIARLLRILRLVRLIKSIPELYQLSMGCDAFSQIGVESRRKLQKNATPLQKSPSESRARLWLLSLLGAHTYHPTVLDYPPAERICDLIHFDRQFSLHACEIVARDMHNALHRQRVHATYSCAHCYMDNATMHWLKAQDFSVTMKRVLDTAEMTMVQGQFPTPTQYDGKSPQFNEWTGEVKAYLTVHNKYIVNFLEDCTRSQVLMVIATMQRDAVANDLQSFNARYPKPIHYGEDHYDDYMDRWEAMEKKKADILQFR